VVKEHLSYRLSTRGEVYFKPTKQDGTFVGSRGDSGLFSQFALKSGERILAGFDRATGEIPTPSDDADQEQLIGGRVEKGRDAGDGQVGRGGAKIASDLP
jgi:hypothetical protein